MSKLLVGIDNTKFQHKVKAPMGMTPPAKKVWKELIDSIPNENILPSDFPIMEAYCETTALYRKAIQRVAMEGATITTEKGSVMNPEAAWADKCSAKLAILAAKLRLTPSARKEANQVYGKPAETQSTTELGKLING